MTEFTFDTSGAVELPSTTFVNGVRHWSLTWSDLSPFMQGYVRAAMEETFHALLDELAGLHDAPFGFSWIAPATLAAMMADCEAWKAVAPNALWVNLEGGRRLWTQRNTGWPAYPLMRDELAERLPPVTLIIRDDGLVYQEARTQ